MQIMKIATVIAIVATTSADAQSYRAAASSCRDDIRRLCADVQLGGGRIISCLREHANDLSEPCRNAIGQLGDRTAGTSKAAATNLPPDIRVERDLAYGPHPEQRIDVYAPAHAKGAPALLLVHGGGWQIGDKANAGVVENKVAHWVPKGFVIVSVDYRMLPDADPKEQAGDAAAALAFAQSKARSWGADPSRFMLMGHSAGAHLASLLAANPEAAYRRGAKPWLGTVALDSAAMNVVAIMQASHFPLYDKAFGSDPAYWQAVSPAHQLKGKSPPMLLVCSTRRAVSCAQARAFADKAIATGARVEILPLPLSHGDINAALGSAADYTAKVDVFLRSLQ
jgi:arylformamidase